MEPEPAPIRPRNFLGLPKKGDEKKEDEIGIDPRLKLEVSCEIFRVDLAVAFLELERGMQGMIDFFHERDQRPDVAIAQPGARIVSLELFDQPARIINADVQLVVCAPEKSAGQLAELARIRARQTRELRASARIDQAILEIDPDLRVGSFEQALDLAEERLVHNRSDGPGSSSRLSNESESRFNAQRTSRNRSANPSKTSLRSQRRAVACDATNW